MPTIFISGGSKGIGLALAKKYYAAGWKVGISARGAEALSAAKQEMPDIITFPCDMSKKDKVQTLGKKILKVMGNIDILVNNAGVFMQGTLLDEPEDAFESMMALNLNSAYYLTKIIGPHMRDRKHGAIVNICSVASIKAYPGGGTYGISKYALLGFSRNLREELMEHGVRVISVIPGAAYTASWEGMDIDEQRLMPATDIADIVWAATDLTKRSVVEDIIIRPQLGDL